MVEELPVDFKQKGVRTKNIVNFIDFFLLIGKNALYKSANFFFAL
jgi:hypothetical protein